MSVSNERRYLNEIIPRYIELEPIVVPITGINNKYYISTLQEVPGFRPDVPKNLIVSTNPSLSDQMNLVSNRFPRENEYALSGQDIYLHPSMAGSIIYCRYYGIGSIIRAEHINTLIEDVNNLKILQSSSDMLINTAIADIEGKQDKGKFIATCINSVESIPVNTIVKLIGENGECPIITGLQDGLDVPYGISQNYIQSEGKDDILLYGIIDKPDYMTDTIELNQIIYTDSTGILTVGSVNNKKVGSALSNNKILINLLTTEQGDESIVPEIPLNISIDIPETGSTFTVYHNITMAGTASSGPTDLSSTISWSSDQLGFLGTGSQVFTNLPTGVNIIEATVTENLVTVTDQIQINITSLPSGLYVIIAEPTGGSFAAGSSIIFTSVANDDEDGEISYKTRWVSDIDGVLGIDTSFLSINSLSVGVHSITASVIDSNGNVAEDNITITIY
jgi:hypothetical protein